MAMDSYYQSPYVQKQQIKFENYQPQIMMKSRTTPPVQDYSIPLHVDCSVEYELPDCAKPPQGVKIEPLLMIHPCHFRNLERQRRRPFENNMPQNSLVNLESRQQPKQQRIINNNLITKQHQQIPNRNNNNNNYIYNCDFTTHVVDYQINNNNSIITTNTTNNNNNNSNSNSTNNNNNVQRFNRNSNLLRNHPYAMPCAPRYTDMHYSNSHLPTLIYNV